MFRRALHLVASLLVFGGLLYGGASRAASEAPAEPATGAHIALLLPAGSDAFARAADAVRAGFMEASRKHSKPALPVRLYAVGDNPQLILTVYRDAIARGARMVVGPLTRNGVSTLAAAPQLVTVPTLALNVPERNAAIPTRLYMLSLQIEVEARQVAQLALAEGRRRAFTVSERTALSARMRDAFVQAFRQGGGQHVGDYAYGTDATAIERMRQAAASRTGDMVFYALDPRELRAVRPAMSELTGYGTSQVNPGSAAPGGGGEVSDVRFVDMPWMVQPDHPAVMIYERGPRRESDDLERLYALGIDAFRVREALMSGNSAIEVDGVTGRLKLGPDGQFQRGLLITLIDGGRLTVLGETRP